jgi:hypothetical protein
MSKTNSQSTQAEECGVSKISAEERRANLCNGCFLQNHITDGLCQDCYSQKKHEAFWDNIPSYEDGSRPYLASDVRKAVNAEFDELVEEHYEEKSLWAAQQHKDAAEIDYLTSTINTKNSKIKYLEGRLEELVGNAIKTKTYHQSDVDKRVEELEDNN